MAWAKGRPHVACEKGPRCLLEFGFYLWLGEPQDPTTRERMRAARAPQVWAPGQGQRVGLEPKDQVPMLPPPHWPWDGHGHPSLASCLLSEDMGNYFPD